MRQKDFFGPNAKFHHVGLAVRSIRDVSSESEVVLEPSQKVRAAFIYVNGIMVELIEPAGEDSPVARSLREGVKLLHLCFEVPDLEAALRHCKPEGFHRISAPQPVRVFGGRRIAWVFSKQYGLFELVERAEEVASEVYV